MARVNHDIEPESPGGNGHDEGDARLRQRRRLFSGDDPLALSLPLLTVGGLRLRVHWIVPLYLACELVAWPPHERLGVPYVASLVGSLMVMVLLREVARGFFARWMGSSADCVTLWPLGGLDSVATPGTSRPVAAEAGGLLAGLVLLPVLALAALAAGSPATDLLFNPFSPRDVLNSSAAAWTPWRMVSWSMYYMDAVLLGVNLLLPMFPMDAGRLLAAWQRSRRPHSSAQERAARIGMVASVALFICAAAFTETRLMAIAACGFVATLVESRRAQFLRDGVPGMETDDPGAEPIRREVHPRHREHRELVTVPPLEDELDRVLAKISREGLSSLTAPEREILARETERRQRG